MKQRGRSTYDKQFKLDAIRIYEESGKKIRDVENELGIGAGCISHWRRELKTKNEEAFPGNGKMSGKELEIFQLKKELAIVKEERDILKKAIGIFSEKK